MSSLRPGPGTASSPLRPQHQQLLRASGLSTDVIRQRGYYSEEIKANLARLGFSSAQRQTPALVIPIHDLAGRVTLHQIRPDNPREYRGKPLKYETPYKSSLIIDVPPAAREKISDPREPLFVTEGVRKADAAVSKGLCSLGLLGVWGWKNQDEFWTRIPLAGRTVYVAFDSDLSTNRSVQAAALQLNKFLAARQAEVRVLVFPAGANGEKVGLDDYLADHTNNELLELASTEVPAMCELVEDSAVSVSYRSTPEGLFIERERKSGVELVPLTNFSARIVSQALISDGVDQARELEIEAKVKGEAVRVSVAADKFDTMGWVTPLLGAEAIVHAGYGTRDHARAAMQQLSGSIPTAHLFSHLGWVKYEGRWYFLHANGAIGADPRANERGASGDPIPPNSAEDSTLPPVGPMGPILEDKNPNVLLGVRLPDSLLRYVLPEPPPPPLLQRAIRASLGMLEVGPDRVVLPVYAAIWRATLGDVDFSLHLAGQTGVGKSELAALATQHYGAGLDARHLPGAWSSTANALEKTAFHAKDVVFPVDDWVPRGSQSDVERLQRDADRLLRAQGNHSGRSRCNRDGSPKEGKAPRCLILSTGEDIPEGASLNARMLVVEMRKGQLNWLKLSDCQRDAAEGLYAQTMAGYVRWLAARYDTIRAKCRQRREAYRQEFQSHKAHPRVITSAADLLAGFETYLDFAEQEGVLSAAEAEQLFDRLSKLLTQILKEQRREQNAISPVVRFLTLLRTLFLTGRAHAADSAGGAPEENPERWGWEEKTIVMGEETKTVQVPRGKQIGWIAGFKLMLDARATVAEAKKLAAECDQPLHVSDRTLGKLLYEKNLLTERSNKRYTVKRRLMGTQHHVLELHASKVIEELPGDLVTQEELIQMLLQG